MRKNNCKVIRRELDELMLGDAWSSAATEHLRGCASCREFHEQQTKLRQIVGSLGTVEAPADFDFRLRARLANSANSEPGIYWAIARRGLAVAAMVIVIATGAILVRNVMNQPATIDKVAQQSEVHPAVPSIAITRDVEEGNKPEQAVAGMTNKAQPGVRKSDRRPQIDYRKRPMASVAISGTRADVIKASEPMGVAAAFPIDTSIQSFTVSTDDGRGNAKTISVPTISFGSQRIMQNGNPFAPKRDW
jgi:hypothetical protein